MWMPARTSEGGVGRARLSNGQVLTRTDRTANRRADTLAKMAAAARAPPQHALREATDTVKEVKDTMRYIGRVAVAANSSEEHPHRDSEASRWAKAGARRKAEGSTAQRKPLREARPPTLGGHAMRLRGHGSEGTYECGVCRRWACDLGAMAGQRCHGAAAMRWARAAEAHARRGQELAQGHLRALSGDVLWCVRCGAYATSKARGLTMACPGNLQGAEQHPRRRQLAALRSNVHPTLGAAFPGPVLECDLYRADEAVMGCLGAAGCFSVRRPAEKRHGRRRHVGPTPSGQEAET